MRIIIVAYIVHSLQIRQCSPVCFATIHVLLLANYAGDLADTFDDYHQL